MQDFSLWAQKMRIECVCVSAGASRSFGIGNIEIIGMHVCVFCVPVCLGQIASWSEIERCGNEKTNNTLNDIH